MSNFAFLDGEWPELAAAARQAEALIHLPPHLCGVQCRFALEQAVHWIYDNDEDLRRPPGETQLNGLVNARSFKDNLPPNLWPKVKLIQSVGNRSAHPGDRPAGKQDVLRALVELHHVLYWLAACYTTGDGQRTDSRFDPKKLPAAPETVARTMAELEAGFAQLREEREMARKALEADKAAWEQRRRQMGRTKARNTRNPDPHNYNEQETRRYLIDVDLREAGWDPDDEHIREYPVSGMHPTGGNPSGQGKVDYVLWGKDGKPLAVVEAKRQNTDPEKGRVQARRYAQALEDRFGQRPVIYYTNGHRIMFWDDQDYPEREVYGFHTRDQLQLLVERRTTRKTLKAELVAAGIIDGRYYQKQAVQAIAEHFEARHRKALLVMATGTGKTRTAAALINMMQKGNWAFRVLFLADRVALVNQAAGSFKQVIPDADPMVLDGSEIRKTQRAAARICVGTYPTVMNLIEAYDEQGRRLLGTGHFDLIIVDEAHRSVYSKYGAIFQYFDSLLVGLTATPKDEVDRDTYGLFDLSRGRPTYAYDLDQAVKDKYLVPFHPYDAGTQFQRRGIVYNQLSDEDKLAYEETFYDDNTDQLPDQIDSQQFNHFIFNPDTVDKVLENLMTNGIRVAGGDRLGKTIIFARSHAHAELIKERFNRAYPQYRGEFARVIDSQTCPGGDPLIKYFRNLEGSPHIAISVDMMDTGVDVPGVVNLVFFKIVRSRTKFWQMIGRGTRTCEDLFGPGMDKKAFYIFDHCGNFHFFAVNPQGAPATAGRSLSENLCRSRFQLALALKDSADEGERGLAKDLLDGLHRRAGAVNAESFMTRSQGPLVERLRDRGVWDAMTDQQIDDVGVLATLPSLEEDDKESYKRFDHLITRLQLRLGRRGGAFERDRRNLNQIVSELRTAKAGIAAVKEARPVLDLLAAPDFWDKVTVNQLEEIRLALRRLTLFLDGKKREALYTNLQDDMGELRDQSDRYGFSFADAFDLTAYREQVTQYVRNLAATHVPIYKLRHNQTLTAGDLEHLETLLYGSEIVKDEATLREHLAGEKPLSVFIRELVGLDRAEATRAFGAYLDHQHFSAGQIQFINQVIEYLTQNGIMPVGAIYESPFTDLSDQGPEGLFEEDQVEDIVAILKRINANALDVA